MRLTTTLAVAFLALAPMCAWAAKTTESDHPKKTEWRVVTVTSNAVEISTTDGKETKPLEVKGFTEYFINGKPAKLADIKEGMKIEFTMSAGAASRIQCTDETKPQPTKQKYHKIGQK